MKQDEKSQISGDVHETLRETLSEGNECFVLITCGKPTASGQMEVKMSHYGDDSLAAYLLENAQLHFEQTEEPH